MKPKKPKKPAYEKANCAICGLEFDRLAIGKRAAKFCKRTKCNRIRAIKNSVATFGNIPNKPSVHTANIDYYGNTTTAYQ